MLDLVLAEDNFSLQERSKAEMYSQDKYNEAFEAGCLTSDEAACLVNELEIFTLTDQREMEKLEKSLEQHKISYFDYFGSPKANQSKQMVELIEGKIKGLMERKFAFEEYTCQRVKEESKNYFLNRKTPRGDMRKLSKDPEWKLMWSISKDPQTVFGKPTCQLSHNQLLLVFWSKLYDSIHESMEPPPDNCLDDDLAIDGWFLKQRRKKNKDDKYKGDQVFLMAKNEDEVRQIMNMNDEEGRSKIQSQFRDLKNGPIRQENFSHVKAEKQLRANRMQYGR